MYYNVIAVERHLRQRRTVGCFAIEFDMIVKSAAPLLP